MLRYQARRVRISPARLAGFVILVIGALLSAGISAGWWLTDLEGRNTAHRLADAATRQWSEPEARLEPGKDPVAGSFSGSSRKPLHPVAGIGGPVVAVVRVPRFGPDWRMPVQRGTGSAVLRQGLGMYLGSAAPGTIGNLALAGHRTTWGAPLKHLDRLRKGDRIEIWTADAHFTYAVEATGVTSPAGTRVIQPGVANGRAMLTMTTCHPEFSARERLWIHALLVTPVVRAEPPTKPQPTSTFRPPTLLHLAR